MARKKRVFREYQHPRDDIGRFTSGRGSRKWAERALAAIDRDRPLSMAASPVSAGAPSGVIDLGAVLAEHRSFHPSKSVGFKQGQAVTWPKPGASVTKPRRYEVAKVGEFGTLTLRRREGDRDVEIRVPENEVELVPEKKIITSGVRTVAVSPAEATRLAKEVKGSDPQSEFMRQALLDPGQIGGGTTAFVARDGDGKLVGALAVVDYGGEDDDMPAYTKIEHAGARGGGVGTALTRAAVQHAVDGGSEAIYAEPIEGSVGFWNRMGLIDDPLGTGQDSGMDKDAMRAFLAKTPAPQKLTRNVSPGKIGGMTTPPAKAAKPPRYAKDTPVEVLMTNFDKPGFPSEWRTGKVDDITDLDGGFQDITIRFPDGSINVQRVNSRGTNKKLRLEGTTRTPAKKAAPAAVEPKLTSYTASGGAARTFIYYGQAGSGGFGNPSPPGKGRRVRVIPQARGGALDLVDADTGARVGTIRRHTQIWMTPDTATPKKAPAKKPAAPAPSRRPR